ncbi:MAG TPA: hypothetical protein VKQ52_05155, partial [Puia sp.]|nr:hypothetical protein [Puia sp.]
MLPSKYLFFLLVASTCLSCRNSGPERLTPTAFCRHPKKIVVYKENVYDLNGYADEGGGDPFRLFDENDGVDPGNEPDAADGPHTNPQPTLQPAIYFPPGKGNRIVIDLQTTYRLAAVYLYDRSRSPDSVWIYTGDMLHWKQKAAFTAISWFTSSCWRKFPVGDSSRYVLIRFSSPKTNITEMVLYGSPDGAVPPPPSHPSGAPAFTGKPMKEFLGVNDYSGTVGAKWMKPFYYSRLYSFAVDFDRDTVHAYPQVRYNMTHFGFWDDSLHDYHYRTEDNVRQNHHMVWYT